MRALAPCPWQAGGSRMVMERAQGEPYCWGNRIGPQISQPFQGLILASTIR